MKEFKEFWYSNLYRKLEDASTSDIVENIKEQKDRGIASVVEEMGSRMNEEDVKSCLEYCGRCCIDPDIINSAKEVLKQSSNDLDVVIDRLKSEGIGGITHREGNIVYASYDQCYCPNKTEDNLSSVYCNCSRGWFMELFSNMLDRPVKVELKRSILGGADSCDFMIYL